jgi:hypothetical protein
VTEPDLVQVHLLELPVGLWAKAREQSNELLREFTLMAESSAGLAETDGMRAPLPTRLTALVDTLTQDFAGVSDAQSQELNDAYEAGRSTLALLVFHVPVAAAAASQALGDLLDEADRYCTEGKHLLTLASSPDVVAFRRWYLDEFVRQVSGHPPTPWSPVSAV